MTELVRAAQDASFGRVTRLAARALDGTSAAVLLVDGERALRAAAGGGWAPVALKGTVAEAVLRADGPVAEASAGADAACGHGEPTARLAVPLRSSDGTVFGVLCVGAPAGREWTERDAALLEDVAASAVTEVELRRASAARVRAAEALAQGELFFHRLLDNSPDLTLVLGAGHGIVYASPSAERLLGRPAAALQGTSGWELLHPEDRGVVEAADADAERGPGTGPLLRVRLRHAEHGWRTFESTATILEDGPRRLTIVNARDVTDRLTAEARADADERRYAELFEHSPEALALIDAEDRVLQASGAFCRLFGYGPEEVAGRPMNDLIVPEDRLLEGLEYTARVTGGEALETEVVRRRKDGTPIHVALVAKPFREPDGTRRAHVTYRDVTYRKEAEEALRRSEARYRSLIENAMDTVAVLDAEGRVLYQSPTIERFAGWTAEELEGTLAFEHVHPEDLERVRAEFGRLIAEPFHTASVEFRFRHRDGTWRTLEATARNFLDDPAVGGLVVNTRDVTDSRALEADLRQAQKMEAVGRLAGGVAHDFNNLLTSVLGLNEMLLDRPGLPEGVRDDLAEMRTAAERGVSLTRQLLAFSRKQVLQPRRLDLNAAVVETAGLLRRLAGEHVAVVLDLSAGLRPVTADPGQVQQVLMNLVANARDAMPEGGEVRIRTFPAAVRSPGDRGLELEPGEHTVLEVSDRGLGLADEAREHLFEPFFTTKGVGRGTGLGLATVYGIVKQSGGDIEVESASGRGATFRIYLPAGDGDAENTGSGPSRDASQGPTLAGRTVLIVEDEPAVRALVRRILARAGSDVLEAENGEEGLRLALEAGDVLDLVLTDVIMPGLSGPQMYARIAAVRPGLPVLYTSGYTDEELGVYGMLDPDTAFLAKPFTPHELVRRVASLTAGGEEAEG